MRTNHMLDSIHFGASSTGLVSMTLALIVLRSYGCSTFIFLPPFASRALPRFFTTMAALTP